MNKRILCILLAVLMLFPVEAMSSFAADIQDTQQKEQDQEVLDVPQNGQDTEVPEEPQLPQEEQVQENKEYTIRFNLAGGTTLEGETSLSMQVQEGELPDSGAVPEIVKKGYLFRGWLDETGGYYKFDQPVTSDIALLASWSPITYRVQFDLNGGSGEEIPERIFTYDKEELLPTKVGQKPEHSFWGLRQKDVGFYQEGSYVKNLTDQDGAVVTLKAVWKRGRYKVRFDANGGTGKMRDQTVVCGKVKRLHRNQYTNPGYTFVGWNTQKDGKGVTYKDKEEVNFQDQGSGSTVILFAMWKGNPYHVKYDGNGANGGTVGNSSHVYGTPSKLRTNHFKRKAYSFVGWNTQKDGKGKTYPNGSKVSGLTTVNNGTVILYAKWKPKQYKITYHTRNGKLSKSARKTYNINSKQYTLPIPVRRGYDFDGWYKDKSLKRRVSELKQGSIGNRTYYAKWVRCTRNPRKDSAKITGCRATGAGKVGVSATVKNRIASDDDRYYLVYVNPLNGTPYKMAKSIYKKKKIHFSLKTKENQGYAVSMYGIAVKKKGKFRLISSPSYVKSAEKAATNKSKYKLGKTKKGMQFYNNMSEIVDCGAKNNFLNITVYMVCNNGKVPYQYNGKTYYFNRMDNYRQIVSECNRRGINVTGQVMLNWVDGWTDLIAPKARVKDAAPYYTWNVYQNSAREKMEAIFSYLGSIFGTKDCYISNWILGNEVNNPRGWNYAGNMSERTYFKTYAYAFRALYYAVRSQYSNARVFVCTDNLWNTAVAGGYSAKHTIGTFQRHLSKIEKGIKWNLAYHAYSSPLTYTNFWDGFGITNKTSTPFITMKNLHVLTNYMKKHYGTSVRIILSEQGYSSTWGQANQAAAIAGSYYIAACNPMIDAFIIRSYYDHPVEVAQGLSMGIKGKEAFAVYKYMDTSKSLRYTKRYLKLIGISSWKKLVPGYHKSRLNRMYRK